MPKKNIPVTVTCMARWWDRHFYSTHDKPVVATDVEFERVYLQRKRFLFDHFGEFGIGEEHPVRDGKFVNVIMKWCVDFIPYLLGVKLTCLDEGFWSAEPLTEGEVRRLEPVDITTLPFAEWIRKRTESLRQRYGKAEIGQLVEGSVNAAVRVRGEDFYRDLVADRQLAGHLLNVITETVIMTYEFLAREFELREIFLANCSNAHIGPALYEQMGLPLDVRVAERTRPLFGTERFVYVHHCDTPADKFVDLYARIPGICKLDGADTTDIRRLKKAMPEVRFCAMINPAALNALPPLQCRERIAEDLAGGADELLIANVDPAFGPGRVHALLRSVSECCEQCGAEPRFSVPPFTEDEYEWSFPAYQGRGTYQCRDDWRLLTPKP